MVETTPLDGPTAPTVTEPPCLEMSGISKQFGGHQALKDVSIALHPGQVLALCGANGAGKSTLVRILAGVESADSGTIRVRGQEESIATPGDATRLGLSFIHQELNLVPKFTALQNIAMGADHTRRSGVLDLRGLRRKALAVMDRIGYAVPLDAKVEQLSVSDRWMVSLARSLMRDARIVAMDEPTASFTQEEADRLYGIVDELTADGVGILYISHRLEEGLHVSDDVTVLRNGRLVGSYAARDLDVASLTRHIVGRDVDDLTHRVTDTDPTTAPVLLQTSGLTREPRVRDVDLTIHRGEILGVAGVEGNGQAELVEAIMGMRPGATGSVRLSGADLAGLSTRRRREAGIGYIPEDRHRHALLLDAPLWENRVLGHQTREPNVSGPFIDRKGARSDTQRIVEEYDVRTPGIDVLARALSGGNQQKLIIGREMTGEPSLLVAAHPTRGVDVGAQAAIWDHIKRARRDGLAVLLISADLDELIGLSDTIRVILRGRLVPDVFDPATVTPQQLGSAMTGAGDDAAGDVA